MPDLRSERFEKLVLGLRGLILVLIQGRRPVCGLGRADVGQKGPSFRSRRSDFEFERPDLDLRELN